MLNFRFTTTQPERLIDRSERNITTEIQHQNRRGCCCDKTERYQQDGLSVGTEGNSQVFSYEECNETSAAVDECHDYLQTCAAGLSLPKAHRRSSAV